MTDHLVFSGNPLDRASNLRHDPNWVASQLAADESRYLVFSGLNVMAQPANPAHLVWLEAPSWRPLAENGTQPLLLGVQNGVAHFAVDLPPDLSTLPRFDGAEFADVRGIAPALSADEGGIVAQARALIDWHSRHRFCGVCGSSTMVQKAGSSRRCEGCGKEHFPRTDPVVIMVVWREDRCLLGRRSGRPGAAYSCLAGFIDQGETIEEAVRREAMEEAGALVDEVVYHTSQPWPFPSQLMIGCFAHATTDEIKVDELELTDVGWFTREQVRPALAGMSRDLTLPGSIAIAHHLISDWCERRHPLFAS